MNSSLQLNNNNNNNNNNDVFHKIAKNKSCIPAK